MTVHSSSS